MVKAGWLAISGCLLILLMALGLGLGLASETPGDPWEEQAVSADPVPEAGSAAPGQPPYPQTPLWLWAGGGTLVDVTFSGLDGWLCGRQGTVGHTTDGGATWTGQYVGRMDLDLYGIAASSADLVWAVGDDEGNGTIIHSWTGGETWMEQAADTDWSFAQGDVAFVDANTGWAVGTYLAVPQGLIQHTVDGGFTWGEQSSETPQALHGVAFADANNGWAVGGEGTILHTTDGGATWLPQTSGITEILNDVFALDASHAWVVGDNLSGSPEGTILRTTDGGASWIAAGSVAKAVDLHAVAFADSNHGWAVGVDNVTLHTTDGGVTWTQQDSIAGFEQPLHGIAARSTNDAMAVGDWGALLRTSDGGTHWTGWSPVTNLHAVDLPARNEGWIAGSLSIIAHTTDGGQSWGLQLPDLTEAALYDLSFVDTSTGFVAGVEAGGQTLRTTNGGDAWVPGIMSPAAGTLYAVDARDSTHAWAAGWQRIYSTTDGLNWSLQLDRPGIIYGIEFVDDTVGWAVGQTSDGYGIVSNTVDAGATWTTQWLNASPMWLRDVSFSPNQKGWAVGQGGTPYPSLIIHTDDGTNWTQQSPPTGMVKDLEGVFFYNDLQGWAVGEDGTVLSTLNGGGTWTTEAAQSEAWLQDVASDGTDLWAVGWQGTILKRRVLFDPPLADFYATPLEGTVPLKVDFASTSLGYPTAWWWDFGDGSMSTEENPTHTYESGGLYTVKLTALNAGGSDTLVRHDYINAIQLCYPVSDVSIDGPTTGISNTLYAFTATVSPADPTLPVTFTWQATDYEEVVESVHSIQNSQSYSWTIGWQKVISVTAENCGGVVSATHVFSLPLPTCGDPYEPNDGFDQAYLLDPLDPAGYDAYICHESDQDYFEFDVEFGETISLTLSNLPANYDLALWDPDGYWIATSDKPGQEEEEIIYEANDAEGLYRARVYGADGAYSAQPYHLEVLVSTPPPPSVVVNTTDDTDDGTCDATHCSLREAIHAINTTGDYRIEFDIPDGDPGYDGTVWLIQPAAPLPAVTQMVHLDGTTQTANRGDTNPQGPEIVLDGGLAGSGANGLVLQNTLASDIRGLVIGNWQEAGIRMEAGRQNEVRSCYVGTGPDGTAAAPNQNGIVLSGGSLHHIGRATDGQGNLISGNLDHGVHLSGTGSTYLEANKIGTDRTGLYVLGNGQHGVYLTDGAEDNVIGGNERVEGNVISGNGGDGVQILGALGVTTQGNQILNNYIGVNSAMFLDLGNGQNGVYVYRSQYNAIGSTAGYGNVIGGNALSGVHLQLSDHNLIAGNWIGVDRVGWFSTGNGEHGIYLETESELNTIGSDNTIANNGGDGVLIQGADCTGNTITQNSITENDGLGIHNEAGGNTELAPPIITRVESNYVMGVACPLCDVELFSDMADEGDYYEGWDLADAHGNWLVVGPLHRHRATATATDAGGNTSQFTVCYDEFEPNDDFDQASVVSPGDAIESFICRPDDQDYFVFPAGTGSIIHVELDVPGDYVLELYDSNRHLLEATGEDLGLEPREIERVVREAGDFYLRVAGLSDACDVSNPYTLRVTAPSLPIDVEAWLDDGWMGSPYVYKLIPDADGPATRTYVDVVVKLDIQTPETIHPYVDVIIPDDQFGAPSVRQRSWLVGGETPLLPSHEGGGRYRVFLHLEPDLGRARTQVQFHFGIPPGVVEGDVVPSAEVRLTQAGDVVGMADAPAIHLVSYVPAIIITNRHRLFSDYLAHQTADLLGEVTQAAQGPSGGVAGSREAAIYYVDHYSEEARDWDNETASFWSSESQANEVANIIDDLVEDWFEDTGTPGGALLIVGDDDVIPFYRRKDPCDGDDAESAHPNDDDPILEMVIDNDFFFTENRYADTDDVGWREANIELMVGRIVGDRASEMLSLFQNGLAGPDYGDPPTAMLASWDHFDLYYSTASTDSVLEWVRDYGFSASRTLVDNDDWRKRDFLARARTPYALLITGNHGEPWATTAPPDRVDIGGDEISTVISATAPLRRPFYAMQDCRVGFTLVTDGLIDYLIRQEASGAVASAGLSYGFPAGSDQYTEELFKMFWEQMLDYPRRGWVPGVALMMAKINYDPPTYWYCRHYKAVMELTLFGVPWMWVPPIQGTSSSSAERSAADQVGWADPSPSSLFSSPEVAPTGGYTITAEVDASTYQITQPVPGFDLVEIEGFRQGSLEGPLLPVKDVSAMLPPGSEVTAVSVEYNDVLSLGQLDIPTWIPPIALASNGRDGAWIETPPEVGVIPVEPFTYTIKDIGTHLVLHVHLMPLTYDAATDEATLGRQITVQVNYTSPVALAITDSYLDPSPHSPGEPAELSAEVVNVSDGTAVFTTSLTVLDMHGVQVGTAASGPYTVPVASILPITPTFTTPGQEGAYRVRLEAWQDGEAVAEAEEVLEVVALAITAFEGPQAVVPGQTATFSATVANYGTQALETIFVLRLQDANGGTVALLTRDPETVPAQGETTVSFDWNSATASSGRYQATVSVTPGPYARRVRSRTFTVGSRVYLPFIRR